MKAKGLMKKDVIQAVRIAARDAAKSPDTNPLLVEALNVAVTVLMSTDWRVPHKSRRKEPQ